MIKKTGSPEPTLETFDTLTGKSQSFCPHCGKTCSCGVDKKGFVNKQSHACPDCKKTF